MCGINGLIRLEKDLNTQELEALSTRMSDSIAHRGPDDQGHWADPETGLVLSQRRLAIIDLSPEGHQPMISADERYVITFNGEIYNFLELRKPLEERGHIFRGHSDSEVMLAHIQHHGIEKTLKAIYGMFAIALYDRKEKTLTLARDHLGKKPLYFGHAGKHLAFASELKALVCLPGFETNLNRGALSLFLRHNYVPAPYSIYEGIYKLNPGSFVTYDLTKPMPKGTALLEGMKSFWSMKETVQNGQSQPFTGSFEQAAGELEDLLKHATKLRMISDVPLGAFLSGGIDSSLIVALMQSLSDQKVKTYSIGFEEAAFNESDHAEAVAVHLGTDHKTFFVTSEETREVIPRLADIYDEPFADMSQIPTWHVSRLARQEVTVALSGDGGDESFAGYDRYKWAQRLCANILRYPALMRLPAAALIRLFPARTWDVLMSPVYHPLKKALGRELTGHRLHIAASYIQAKDFDDLFMQIISHWKDPGSIVKGGHEPLSPVTDPANDIDMRDIIARAQYFDTIAYLPDDILVKVDRASMDHALEARAPLLDKNVVEFAWRLPTAFKYENGNQKRILKHLLNRYVPQEITDRPKQGFGVPMAGWLRGPLKGWAEDLLSESELEKQDLFHPAPIRNLWDEHISGKRDWNYYLWDILIAQSWAQRWM